MNINAPQETQTRKAQTETQYIYWSLIFKLAFSTGFYELLLLVL